MGTASLQRLSPSTLQAAASKYLRNKNATLEQECADANRLRYEAHARARAAEEREERAKALAAKRLLERNAARESERAWREELHAADDEDDGGEDAPNLRIIGKDAKGEGGGKGRAPWPLWMVQLIIEKIRTVQGHGMGKCGPIVIKLVPVTLY